MPLGFLLSKEWLSHFIIIYNFGVCFSRYLRPRDLLYPLWDVCVLMIFLLHAIMTVNAGNIVHTLMQHIQTIIVKIYWEFLILAQKKTFPQNQCCKSLLNMWVCLDLFVNDAKEYSLWFPTISTLIWGEGGNNNLVSEKFTKYFIFLNIIDDDCSLII